MFCKKICYGRYVCPSPYDIIVFLCFIEEASIKPVELEALIID
jgi:hypothetical protein